MKNLNLQIRIFRTAIENFVNENPLEVEIKSLVLKQIARDVEAEADKACVMEQLAQEEQDKAGQQAVRQEQTRQQEQTGNPVKSEEVKTNGN